MQQGLPSKMTPALIGGAALGVASGIPIVNLANCACCAWVIGGGVLASYLWLRDAPPQASPPYGDGVVLGLLTGVVGVIVSTIVSLPFTLMGTAVGFGGMEQMEELLQNEDIPPALASVLENLGGAGIGIGSLIIGLLFGLIIYPIFAAAGAAIGTALFNKKGAAPTPYVPPMNTPPPPPSSPTL